MFKIKIENPFDEDVSGRSIQDELRKLFDFKMIKLMFKKSFYENGYKTDRTKMELDELDIEHKQQPRMKAYLKIEKGLIEFTIPKSGKYEIIQQSRSSNNNVDDSVDGPAMGVNLELELVLKKVCLDKSSLFLWYI